MPDDIPLALVVVAYTAPPIVRLKYGGAILKVQMDLRPPLHGRSLCSPNTSPYKNRLNNAR